MAMSGTRGTKGAWADRTALAEPKLNMKSKYRNVALIGLDEAGKTAILDRWNPSGAARGPETETFALRTVATGRKNLRFWDFDSKPENRTYVIQAARHGDFAVIVLVLGAATQHHLEQSIRLLSSMVEGKDRDAPFVVLASQQYRHMLPLESIRILFDPATTLRDGRRRNRVDASKGDGKGAWLYVWSPNSIPRFI